jgi:hypothetical protein
MSAWASGAWASDAWYGTAWYDSSVAVATITGTLDGSTEADIVAGGQTIIITLTNETFVAFNDTIRQAIIDGLDSAQSETLGWNNEVRDKEVTTAVVRDSDTQVTITLTASPLYDITANEVITVTVPASALTGASPLVATPTQTVSFVAEDAVQPVGGHGAKYYYDRYLQKKRRKDKERRELMQELDQLEGVDREIARILHKDEQYDTRTEQIAELDQLIQQADINAQRREFREMNQKLANAFTRAYMEQTFSAIEAFERQLEQAIEEEEFMLLALAILQ